MQIALNSYTVCRYTADMNKISSSPTFCTEPWTTLNIDQTGRVLPCLHSMGWNQQTKCENTMGNIKQHSIQSIIRGPRLQEIKAAIARGEWHDFCCKCRENEAISGASARTLKIESALPEIKQQIDQDIGFFKLTNLTVNWTNLCNLTCTYCNPRTSTAWQQAMSLPITHVRNESAGLIELVRNNRDSLTGLSLGGGEPLLQRGLLELLQEVDSARVNVMITTNLSMDLDKNAIYQELRTWPNVAWMISFDNVEPDKFEYVRHGADWQLFKHNIQQLTQDHQRVVAHPASSIYCAFDLDSYYEFCMANKLTIYWCDLKDPPALDVRRLPDNLRQQAQAAIDRILELYSDKPENDHLLSLDMLRRYHTQLGLPVTGTVTPAQWHLRQERLLQQQHTFAELWPRLTNNS